MKEEPKFHVIMRNDFPEFVYVGTPEEAAKIGAEYQKKFDKQDGVKSKWKRVSHVHIESCDGQIGEKQLEKIIIQSQEKLLLEKTVPIERATSDYSQAIDGELIDVNKDS